MNQFINLTYSNKLLFLLRLSDTNSIPYENDKKLYHIISSIWYGGSNNSSILGITCLTFRKIKFQSDLNIDFDNECKILLLIKIKEL